MARETREQPDLTRVWDLGVRIFHWLLVSAMAIAAVTGLYGPRNRLNLHLAAGVAVAGLVAFRIVWGFTGSTHARFSGFPIRPAAIAAHLSSLFAFEHGRYEGHNPLGSMMVFALLAILTLSVVTGVVTLGGVDKQGPLAFMVSYAVGGSIQAVHRTLAYVLLGMVAGHLAGVAYESMRGDTNLVLAMITGDKADSAGAHNVKPTRARPVLAGLVVALLLAGATYATVSLSSRPAFGVPVARLDPTYAKECGSCHMAYPPSLASRSLWIALLAGLGDHFGEDASLEPDLMARIRVYLTNNSAEFWDTRPSREFATVNPRDPLRLTATPYWIWTHRSIPEKVFKSRAVGAKGACNACHLDALTGRFDPQDIDLPEQALK
jgi:cytochrome b